MNIYIVLFLGLLVGGETLFLPAVYLVLVGKFSFTAVLISALLATIISDSFWYVIGRFVPMQRIKEWKPVRKRPKEFGIVQSHLEVYGPYWIIVSKFIYGTRTLAQVLAGSVKMYFPLYLVCNVVGITLWLLTLFGAAYAAQGTLNALNIDNIRVLQALVSIFLLAIIGISLWLNYWLRKKTSP